MAENSMNSQSKINSNLSLHTDKALKIVTSTKDMSAVKSQQKQTTPQANNVTVYISESTNMSTMHGSPSNNQMGAQFMGTSVSQNLQIKKKSKPYEEGPNHLKVPAKTANNSHLEKLTLPGMWQMKECEDYYNVSVQITEN